jgi:hypothetical protein
MTLAPGFALPDGFRVQPLGEHSGWGEDDPITSDRMARDGWNFATGGHGAHGLDLTWRFDPPHVAEKPVKGRDGPTLRVNLHGINEKQGQWYVETAQIVGPSGDLILDLGRTDWADLDHNGDVLYAASGRLYRFKVRRSTSRWRDTEPILVADLNDMSFQRVVSPSRARTWPRRGSVPSKD